MRIPDTKTCPCEACIRGKAHAFPFKSRRSPVLYAPGEKVYFDLGGPFVPTFNRKKYRAIFVDETTGYWTVAFLRNKSDFNMAKERYRAWVKTQTKTDVAVEHGDRRGEFTSNEQKENARDRGVEQHFSAPYCPEQNGKAERANRTLDEAVTTAMMNCDAPAGFWGEATRWVVFNKKSHTSL